MMDLSALEEEFDQNFVHGKGQGAALCLCVDGAPVLHLCHGEAASTQPWSQESLVPIYSATKAASAACFLLALEREGLDEQMRISHLWPRFPAADGTVAELLSHQLGLAALDRPASLFDLDDCQLAIEQSSPLWAPPRHGYHPHTLGPILDILMQELTGDRLCVYWEQEIRQPLELDFYLSLPASEQYRVAMLRAPRLRGSMPDTPFYRDYFTESSTVHRAFHSVEVIGSAREMNQLQSLQCGCPAKGGVASALGLASFYQALMGKCEASPFTPSVLSAMSRVQCSGWDEILLQESAFTCGAMCVPDDLFLHGFGHAGAGGSHGFCVPSRGLSFAYVMNQMDFGVLPSAKLRALLRHLAR